MRHCLSRFGLCFCAYEAWRLDAKTEELDDCLINGAGMYLKTYKTLLSEKAKRDQDAKLIKTLEIAIRFVLHDFLCP